MRLPALFITYTSAIFALFLLSCGSGNLIIKSPSIDKNDVSNTQKIDSVRINSVIDLRNMRSSRIIGKLTIYREGKKEKLFVLKEPLEDMLLSAFNAQICKDSSQSSFIPVTLTVSQFELISNDYKSYFNYKYSFDFPDVNGNTHSIKIGNHIEDSTGSGTVGLDSMLRQGLLMSGKLFVDNYYLYKSGKPDTLGFSELNHLEASQSYYNNPNRIEEKNGLGVVLSPGDGVGNIRLEYIKYTHRQNSQHESGWGLGILCGTLKSNKYQGYSDFKGNTLYLCAMMSYSARFGLTQSLTGPFIGGSGFLGVGSSIGDYKESGLGYCVGIDAYLGVYLFKQLSFAAGLSHIIGDDSNSSTNLVFKFNITNAYSSIFN